jgi:hypothetical protein
MASPWAQRVRCRTLECVVPRSGLNPLFLRLPPKPFDYAEDRVEEARGRVDAPARQASLALLPRMDEDLVHLEFK